MFAVDAHCMLIVNSFELVFWPLLVCHLPYCSVLSKIGMVLHSVLFIEWFNCIVKDCFIKAESVCVCIEMKWCRLCLISVLQDVSFLFSHKNRLIDNIIQFCRSFEEDEHSAIWSLEYRCIQYTFAYLHSVEVIRPLFKCLWLAVPMVAIARAQYLGRRLTVYRGRSCGVSWLEGCADSWSLGHVARVLHCQTRG